MQLLDSCLSFIIHIHPLYSNTLMTVRLLGLLASIFALVKFLPGKQIENRVNIWDSA